MKGLASLGIIPEPEFNPSFATEVRFSLMDQKSDLWGKYWIAILLLLLSGHGPLGGAK